MFDPIDVHVGTRIRTQRLSQSMSQKELGQKLGVTFQQIQKYEKGANRIGAGRLFRIARILSVPLTYFFENVSSAPQSLVGEIGETPPPRILNGLQSAYMDEAKQLLSAFDQITDPHTRSQIIELARTLSERPKKSN